MIEYTIAAWARKVLVERYYTLILAKGELSEKGQSFYSYTLITRKYFVVSDMKHLI
jgi:hypothetical protein